MKSTKPVIKLEDLLGKRMYFFPDELSNEREPETIKRSIFIGCGGQKFYIHTGENVELTDQQFSILKDAGIIRNHNSYCVNPDFDPIYDYR